MNIRIASIFSLGLLLFAAAGLPCAAAEGDRPRWAAPPLEKAISIRDGRTGERLSLDELLEDLAEADAVFLGETHTDETTHRVELAVYEGLLARRDGDVTLAMEMFERDVQQTLDDYLAGEITEEEFLDQARPWSNYRAAYRPLIEAAKAAGKPVIASNFPRPLLRRVAMEGPEVLQSLEGDEQRQAPKELLPNTDAYWRRADNAMRSHTHMMRGGDRLTSTQSLWDNAMGESVALALDQYPDNNVVHINGDFHSAYWDGAVHQLQQRKPEAKIKTVSIGPTSTPSAARLKGKPTADYVVFAEARATDYNDGSWSVYTSAQIDYEFHLPETASSDRPLPLLIWLVDDGLQASDGMELWRERLGDAAAIAVVEPPYRELQGDLSIGGRWFWADSFSSDVGGMVEAVERIWGYLSRHYPIDPGQVCVAGEGTGATVAGAVALLANRMDVQGVALQPRKYAKVKDFSLPLPELRGEDAVPQRSLTVLGEESDRAWWDTELEAYAEVGLETDWQSLTADVWQRAARREAALRDGLHLPEADQAPSSPKRYIRMDKDAARARHWARLHALRLAQRDQAAVAVVEEAPDDPEAKAIALEIRPEAFAAEGALPRCPGPFGGTTVLLLPADMSEAETRDWMALEENDPIAEQSRFHRLRVATADGERPLPAVLEKLKSENRNNILIVPAVFHADAAWMRSLRRQVGDLEDQMTLQWQPGLGGSEVAVVEESEKAMAATEQPPRHELEVTLDPEQKRLQVTDRIELPPSLRSAGSQFTLSRALSIVESEPAVEKAEQSEGEERSATRYVIQDEPAEGVLKLTYEGVVDFGLSDQKQEYTRGFRETRGTVGPEGVYLDGESLWVPTFDDRLIRFSLKVNLPDQWHVISQGRGTSRSADSVARWESEGPMEQAYLVGGPLTRYTDAAGAVETLVFLREADEALARKYLDTGARYLEMYRDLIGPYPYEKFAVVENFWETGYGMPSFTLLGSQVIRFPFILHSSYPHEILHNWWGNSVFVDYEQGNWCEGLTAYLSDHLIREQREEGEQYRRDTLQKYRDYVQEERDFALTEFRNRHSAATEAVGYGKALMLFHMLRRQVGDDAFRAGLVKLYREQRGQRADWADLREAFEAAADQPLTEFFEQWVHRTGAPALSLAGITVDQEDDQYVIRGTLEQVQSSGDAFQLVVPVVVHTEEGPKTFQVESSKREHALELNVAARPFTLAVDPQFDVFRQLDPRETPPTIGQIFGQKEILAVLPDSAAPAQLQRYRELIESWQSDEQAIETVTDTQLDELPEDRSIWLLGRDNRFVAQAITKKREVEVVESGEKIRLAGEELAFDDHSFVVIARHPENLEQAVGWIAADPAEAFSGVSRKLPHYGKYSYLAFEGTEPTNIVKGQWSTTGSPLVVDLQGDQEGPAETPDVSARPALAELPPVFSSRDLMAHVEWLADPEREGRGLGSPGLEESADYIAEQMAEAGLEPGGDEGGWYQKFTVDEGPNGKPVETVNVIGVLPGNRDDWKEQSIILSAHYDHLGRGWPDVHAGDEGKIHPGADDNASGVAVLLELARVLADEGGNSRNLVFIAFSAEECGRHGSRYYVENPRFPLSGVRGVINLDTVGRLRDQQLAIHGTGTADEWQHIFRGCSYVTGVPSRNVPETAGGSDQMSFMEQGIPAVQLFTGAHGDYHRPTDTIDKVDAAGLVKVATFVKEALTYLVEREPPLTVQIEGAGQSTSSPHSGSGRKVLFGTVPAFDFQGQGVKVEDLVPDSPAQRAGIQSQDVIVRVDETPIDDLREFSEFLKTLEPGQEVQAQLLRDGEEVTVRVEVEQR